jgi:hypothetical protein
MRLAIVCAIVGVGVASFVSACGSGSNAVATLNYTEAGVCPDLGNGYAYVVFEVSTIANQQSGAKTFAFNPALLFVNGEAYHKNANGTSVPIRAPVEAIPAAHAEMVAGGTVATLNAYVAVTVPATSANSRGLNFTNYRLLYMTPANTEGVLPVEANGSSQRFPEWTGCPSNF